MFYNIKTHILSWLLHHANKGTKDPHFYTIKGKILAKESTTILDYEVQFIEGKICWSCHGTGIHEYYDYNGRVYDRDNCWNCVGGWYKLPVWNILTVVKYGNHVFHRPLKRCYEKPEELIGRKFFEGYINHKPSKYSEYCRVILHLCYEKGYIKRWYRCQGLGWRLYWYYPKNIPYNIIHFIKKGRNAYPLIKLKEMFVKPQQDDLPF